MSTKKEQILHKISKIENYLQELIVFQKISLKEIKNDSNQKAAMERFLYLICDSIISLLEMLIAYKDYPKVINYSENVDVLLEKKELSSTEAKTLYKIVGLRNILSHDYEKLDFTILKDVVDNKLGDIENLLSHFKNKLN